jgi:hypothetical protein
LLYLLQIDKKIQKKETRNFDRIVVVEGMKALAVEGMKALAVEGMRALVVEGT